ncbi:hypothetical protein BC828DRAFT_398544 [Blastocladiella britannica]|nr:hypothetical protein BC828DRAFT_398544 [Blastocladiella britannica]
MRQQRTLGGAALVLLALHCFTFVVATAASPARGVRFDSSQTAAGAVAWAPAGSAMADPLASRFGISRASSGSGARLATDGAAPPLTARAGAFQFSLTCADVDAARCAKMLGTLQTAGTVYSALLNLTQPVVVAASYMSFCAHPPSGPTQQFGGSGITTSGCPARLKNALGSAFPTSQWNLFGIDGVDPEYTYPQALAKQLAVEPLSWTGSDVTAQFNVDADLWFEGDPAIKATQTDSLYVVVHEMLHGLGASLSI